MSWSIIIVIVILMVAVTAYLMMPVSNPDIIYFYSDTCPACVAFKPVWDETEPMLIKKGYKITRAVTGSSEDLFQKYKVEAVPTVLFLKKDAEGNVTNALMYDGARTKGDIISFAESNLKK